MGRTFESARDHLDAMLSLVAKVFEREINAAWEAGVLPRIQDEFSGTFVSGDEVTSILKGGAHGGPRNEAGVEKLAALDATIDELQDEVDAALAAARDAGNEIPFDRMRRSLGLSRTEERALWVLIAVEVSSRLRALMRYLVNESGRVYADVGLLETMVYSRGRGRDTLVRELADDGRLIALRLIEPVGGKRNYEESPWLLRSLRVNPRVIELAHGLVRLDRDVGRVAELVTDPPSSDGLLLPPELVQHVNALLSIGPALPGQNGARRRPIVVLAGADGAGRKSLAYGAAAAQGRAVLHLRCAEMMGWDLFELSRLARASLREALIFDAIPLFENIDLLAANPEANRPDRVKAFEGALDGFTAPVAATCAPRDSRPVSLGRGLVMVDVPVPTEEARSTLWRRALESRAAVDLDFDLVAARYPISGGVLLRAASAASSLAEARGRAAGNGASGAVVARDIHAGLRGTLEHKLAGLGRRITWRQGWDDLILPDDSIEEIREFIARMRHKRRVYDDWGFSRKLAKGLGLSALFAGQPGTGKTMVAGLIADELNLDLYQIDLSRIVSKYVGETEKNLAELFEAAEAGHAILLFDEADSLFAKRTEVKSSVDRYANLEVNYLLQRMEAFGGITILTTNMDTAIDEAFKRRISFKVNFPFPEPEDRLKLWRVILPAEALVSGEIDYEFLANKYEMSGGYIRNAVLRAAFLAADDNTPITMRHMMRAANLEYASMGKVVSHHLGHGNH